MSRETNPRPISDMDMMRALRSLPARLGTPDGLTTALRVLASRERQRVIERQNPADMWMAWMDRLNLAIRNLMRPLALPVAGGVFSAVALFSTWVVPTYPIRAATGVDVPTILFTAAALKGTAPVGVSGAAVVVDIIVDQQGRMVDYTVVHGNEVLLNRNVRRNLESFLLFAKFEPATAFGKPMKGRMRLYLNTNRAEVKG
jgi:hypothetical protein